MAFVRKSGGAKTQAQGQRECGKVFHGSYAAQLMVRLKQREVLGALVLAGSS